MGVLDRKLMRDLVGMKGQVFAIVLVMASGVATLVMSQSMLQSLSMAQRSYYEAHRFADIFARIKRAPLGLAERIREIPGVRRVEVRTVVDVMLDVPGLPEPAVGRLISIPVQGEPGLNALYLRAGRFIEGERSQEVVVNEAFAEAHRLKPGDQVIAVINGKREVLEVVGIVLSPEYVYPIREGEILPDDKRFGVFWMGTPRLAAAFDMTGAFNDVAIALHPDASQAEVIRRLDALTAKYGGLGGYGRDEQLSSKYVTNEIRELSGAGLAIPMIFFGVGAFLLSIVLSRQIDTQREELATLKAFGYTTVEVAIHHVKWLGVIVVLSVVLGVAAGGWMGLGVTRFYIRFFHFPLLVYRLDVVVVAAAFLVSWCAALVGAWGAIRRVVRLAPAEAMRPEPPARFRPTLLERCLPRWLVSSAGRMILRQVGRRPVRSLLSVGGIAVATAVLVLGNYTVDAIDALIEIQFSRVQRQDLNVVFVEPRSERALREIGHLAGVMRCEPFRAIPVRLISGVRSRRLAILGLDPAGMLYRPIDERGRALVLKNEEVVLSSKLAELLEVRQGDEVTVEVLEGWRPVRAVRVGPPIADYEGLNAYMSIYTLNRLMREGGTISGAFLQVDASQKSALFSELKSTPQVAGVTIKSAAIETFRETIAETLLRMQAFNVLFAGIIACGVVYNCARISFTERGRELATLRVIGLSRAEVSLILLGELAFLSILALPIGLVMGKGFAALATRFYDTELFRLPLVIYPSTYSFAVLVTLVAVLISGTLVRRQVDRLDLVAVLKTKE